jgi:ribosomal protein S18 acetylase RimI-like enzyme
MLPPATTLAHLATANFARHASWAAERTEGMEVRRWRGLLAVDSLTPCDTFNCILGARLAPEHAPAMIAGAITSFGGRPFSWWVAPGDEPPDLSALLEAHGLVGAEGELAMVLPLEHLRELRPAPDGLTIERVTTAEALAEFAAINAANWSPPDALVLDYYRRTAQVLLAPDCPIRLFVGRVDGVAVAASEGTLEGETVGVYNVSTLAEQRGRGYGTALTVAPLADARQRGRRFAVLQAAPDGVGTYRRLGFTEFGTITEYKPA